MEEITKDDLRQLRLALADDIKKILDNKIGSPKQEFHLDWLRSKAVRRSMNISPTTLQNLRITGKIPYKKILGSYYYSKTDFLTLFEGPNE